MDEPGGRTCRATAIGDAAQVRELVDAVASRRAAERLDTHILRRLRIAVEALADAVERRDRDQIVRTDRIIHRLIYGVAGVPGEVIEPATAVIRERTRETMGLRTNADRVLDEHRKLISALERHDPTEAEHWSVVHVRGAARAALEADEPSS